ncbi:hypothetical protein [Microbacterium azadirachtae]|uniref:hypothetical protein n=1 Tax=Microbacterium azadirachtae TaxID=582680 RepID=UPI000695D64C|nr:hypothetical protein [Microbacterium azadirachtae]
MEHEAASDWDNPDTHRALIAHFMANYDGWVLGERVVEVSRLNRLARRMDGKSDQLDAEQIARAVLGETSTAIPKRMSGVVEVIRTLRVTRSSAVKARSQAFNTMFGVMIGAPSQLRDELVNLTRRTLVNRCLRLRPETDEIYSGRSGAHALGRDEATVASISARICLLGRGRPTGYSLSPTSLRARVPQLGRASRSR